MEEKKPTIDGPSIQVHYNDIPFFIICFIGVVLHSLLLIAFFKDPLKCFKNSGTILVINLAISDLLTCFIAPFYLCVKVTRWSMVLYLLTYTVANGSIVTLGSISIDRFLLVAYPIKHRYLIRGKVIAIWVACLWFVNILYPTKQVIFGPQKHDQLGLNIFGVIITTFSVAMYIVTYFKLKKQARNIQVLRTSIESRAENMRVLKEKQFLRAIIIIAFIAFICIIPHTVVGTIKIYINTGATQILYIVSSCLIYLNYSVNPVIYILFLPNYRKTFRVLYYIRS